MIVNETDASTKWCPFGRSFNMLISGAGSVGMSAPNRDHEGNPFNANCLGSRCMAWVWNEHGGKPEERRGHCGLAGRQT